MKLFKIELDNVGYDDYDSCIIVAESKEQVEELCECNFVKYEEWDTEHHCPKLLYDFKNILSESFNIHNGQKRIITEVDINEIKQPTIICSNFYDLIEKWKMYKNKLVRFETLKEEVYNKTDIIEKNLKEIQTFFKDEIDVISNTKLNIKNFNLEKINDYEVGFCGTLEFVIFDYRLSIDRIGFANQVHVSFHKNDISIIENGDSKYIGYLTYEQIINVYKTVNYFLINKEKIKEMLDKYISQQLNDKIKFISKEINKIENMDFIDDTQKKL